LECVAPWDSPKTTTTLPRIQDLPAAERQAHYDAAQERVRAASREIVAEAKARKPDPRGAFDYRVWHDSNMAAALVVRHPGRTTSLEISADGGRPRAFLNPAKARIQPESDGDFLLIVLSRSLARWVRERQRVNLMGVTPELVGDYSDAQRETWARLKRTCATINARIQCPPSPQQRRAGHRSYA
jgi:hypothetical protein